jgi:membrane fusion protein (multidrug efflux system)
MKYLVSIVAAAALGAGIWYFVAAPGDDAPAAGAAGSQAAAGAGQAPGARGGFPGGPGGFGGGPFGGGQDVPLVAVGPVAEQTIADSVEALGTAQANESVTLTAKVTDTISHVEFDDGDYVEAGDILVQLTNKQEEAQLAEAEANLQDAENALTRATDLAKKGLTAKSDLDTARLKHAAAKAHFDALAAQLQDRLVRAPFSGVLGFRQVSPGTLVQPNTAITTLDDISTIKLDFTVPEIYLEEMRPGASIVARSASYPDREFTGVVRTVGTRIDPITRAVPIRAHVPNPDKALRPGMLLTVEVLTSERAALVVPESAVFQIQNRAYVYRVEGQIAHQQQIEVGAHRFGIVEVKQGLAKGDLVVTQGIIKLRDGSRIRYEPPETGPEVSRSSASQPTASTLTG